MKLWTNQYDLSDGYLDGSLVGTWANQTQMEMGLERKWDSIDVFALSTMI